MRTLIPTLFVVLFATGAHAQVFGTEIFLVGDWRNANGTGSGIDWDDITVVSGGTTTCITSDGASVTGSGTYGDYFDFGATYRIEACSFSPTGGNTGTATLGILAGGPASSTHYLTSTTGGTDSLDGIMISRLDGAVFQLIDIAYRDSDATWLLGQSWSSYTAATTTGGWTPINRGSGPLVLDHPNWLQFNFPTDPCNPGSSVKLEIHNVDPNTKPGNNVPTDPCDGLDVRITAPCIPPANLLIAVGPAPS